MSEPTRVAEHDQQVAAPVVTPMPPAMDAPLAPTPLPAMVVGAADDKAEVDADRAADDALARLTPLRVSRLASPGVAGAIVGAAGGALDATTSAAIESRRGAGSALPAGVRRRMEGAFGGSFSSVRVHDDAASAELSRAVSARAFTVGSDIFFDRGQFAPDTAAGERVLAHELAHTRQPEAGARRLIRRMIDPDLAHEFADVMDEILQNPTKARALAGTHRTILKACAADAGFTGRLDVAMRTVLQDLATADTNPGTDLTAAVNTYKTTYGNPTWTHVAGAAFTPQRQRITDVCGNGQSANTERLSAFGSTACKALHRCLACLEPFEHFKPI